MEAQSPYIPTTRCQIHVIEVLNLFCIDCGKACCRLCFTSEHQQHRFGPIEDVLISKKRETRDSINKLENSFIPNYQKALKEAEENIQRYKDDIRSLKTLINKRRDEFKTTVDNICNELIQEVDDIENRDLREVNEFKEVTDANLREMRLELEHLQLRFDNEKASIEHLGESANREYAPLQPVPHPNSPKFITSALPLSLLCRSVGSIVDVSEIRTVEMKNDYDMVHSVDDSSVWLAKRNQETLCLFDKSGVAIRKLSSKYKIESFAVTPSGDILISDRYHHCIRKICSNGKFSVLVKLDRTHPKGVCLNQSEDIAVCLAGLTGTLAIYLSDGKTKVAEFNKSSTGATLFDGPEKVIQNGNGDYCVIDRYMRESRIMAVDRGGKLRWRYDGTANPDPERHFCATDLDCDSQFNVLVSDSVGKKIHMLDQSGRFLTYILTKQTGTPEALSIGSDDKLWVVMKEVDQSPCKLVTCKYLKVASHKEKS